MIRLHGSRRWTCAAVNISWTRSNSARLATRVNGSRSRLLVEALAPFFQRDLGRGVVQQQDRSQHRAVVGQHGNDVAVDGDRPPVPPPDAQPAQRLNPRLDRGRHGAVRVAHGVALLVAQIQQLRQPLAPVHACARNARHPLRAVVPRLHHQTGVDEHHRVVHVVGQPGVEKALDVAGRGSARGRAEPPVGFDRRGVQRPQPAVGRVLPQGRLVLRLELGELLDQFGIELACRRSGTARGSPIRRTSPCGRRDPSSSRHTIRRWRSSSPPAGSLLPKRCSRAGRRRSGPRRF